MCLKNKEKNIKNYLEGFDEEFKTHTKNRIQETPLLLKLFNDFIQRIYRPSKVYKLALKNKNEISEKLNKTLTEEQKQLFKQWQYFDDEILFDLTEQSFIYGYSMCCQLRDEAIKQYPLNNK